VPPPLNGALYASEATGVKLSAYIVRVDSGFAPNPFGRHCTIACCKPTIRRKAETDDIVVGTGSARYGLVGRLVYAMRVRDVIPLQNYWMDAEYAYKKPSQATAITARGDNIWYQDAHGSWRVVPGAFHDERHRDRDIRGANALVADDFYYFGRDAPPLPDEFRPLLAVTQGHKNTRDEDVIDRFWRWVAREASGRRRCGDPSEFTEAACKSQCDDEDDDDVAEES
jgi:hypothetical protein